MSLIGDVMYQVSHPPTCTSIYHSQGALKASGFACWFTNLSGFVTKLIAKFQNDQVANFSPEVAKYHICQQYFSS